MIASQLLDKVRSKAFTPGARDAKALAGFIGEVDRDDAQDVIRALIRTGRPALAIALAAAEAASEPARSRLLEVVGKLTTREDPSAVTALVEALADDEPRVVKVAARALGRLGAVGEVPEGTSGEIERGLLAASSRITRDDLRGTLIEALGKVGGRLALSSIASADSLAPAAARATSRARTMLTRDLSREADSAIDAQACSSTPVDVRLHCRAGLEAVVLEEVGARLRAKRTSHGAVDAMLESALAPVFDARTFTHLTFPVVDRAFGPGEDLATAIAGALTAPAARHLLATFTRGQVRYRVAWKSGGHRRAVVFDVAARVSAIEPLYVNDPRSSTWEVCIDDARGRLAIELAPRAIVDPRFAYRVTDVPAASHPTVAAALAFIGGVRSDDVVWDPFVGSALELIERARLGPYVSLAGTDLDAIALAAARDNLAQAAVVATLEQGDAREAKIQGVTLMITNPPMGRRVTSGHALTDLLVPFISHAAQALAPGGRLVWITPQPRDTNRAAARAGLVLERACDLDMGGFPAVLQRLVKR